MRMPFAPLEWKQEYSIDEATLDEQHRNFIEVANEVIALANADSEDVDRLLVLLTKLGDLLLAHFEEEEAYLATQDFEGILEHLRAHAAHRRTIKHFLDEARTSQRICADADACHALTQKVAEFVSDWVSRHMIGSLKIENTFAAAQKAEGYK